MFRRVKPEARIQGEKVSTWYPQQSNDGMWLPRITESQGLAKHRMGKAPVSEVTAQVTVCRGYCIMNIKMTEYIMHLNVTKGNFDSWKSWCYINRNLVVNLIFFNTKQIMISVKKEKITKNNFIIVYHTTQLGIVGRLSLYVHLEKIISTVMEQWWCTKHKSHGKSDFLIYQRE